MWKSLPIMWIKKKDMGEAHRQRTFIGTDIPNSQYIPAREPRGVVTKVKTK